jgi:hypothetical protein
VITLAGVRIEIAGRLVREQHGRMGDEGARDRHALLLAARQLLRIMRQARASPTWRSASAAARAHRYAGRVPAAT